MAHRPNCDLGPIHAGNDESCVEAHGQIAADTDEDDAEKGAVDAHTALVWKFAFIFWRIIFWRIFIIIFFNIFVIIIFSFS